MAQKTVTLNPGESKTVSFEAAPTVAKTYQVSVDGLTGSFRAMPLPPFDPWVYDLNGDGYIDDNERRQAVADYYAGIITKEQLNQVLALPSPPAPPPPSPPAQCATEEEKSKAAQDYFDGLITKEQAMAIINLPTCP